MDVMRVVMVKGAQWKTARNPQALAHLEGLGFVPAKIQPPQPLDNSPVMVRKGPNGRIRKVKRRTLQHWMDLGYHCEDGAHQEAAEAAHAKAMAKQATAEAHRRKGEVPKTTKPQTLPKAKGKGKKKKRQGDTRNLVMAELLGEVPERDAGTKAIIKLLQSGYDVTVFRQVLTDWNVTTVTEVPEADRAELLLDLQNRAR